MPDPGENSQHDEGVTNAWTWSYNRRNIGYGYNAFFLGLHNHGEPEGYDPWISRRWFPENRVKMPGLCILLPTAIRGATASGVPRCGGQTSPA